jgi:hypothetical protein
VHDNTLNLHCTALHCTALTFNLRTKLQQKLSSFVVVVVVVVVDVVAVVVSCIEEPSLIPSIDMNAHHNHNYNQMVQLLPGLMMVLRPTHALDDRYDTTNKITYKKTEDNNLNLFLSILFYSIYIFLIINSWKVGWQSRVCYDCCTSSW